MNRFLILAIAASFVAALSAPLTAKPSGKSEHWTAVSVEGLKKQEAWRRTSPMAYARVRLDMNGDGLKDEATLIVDRVRHRSGLRVCLAKEGADLSANCHVLVDDSEENGYEEMGLEVRGPGCRDFNSLNDGPDVGGKVCSRTDVLRYFRVGSSTSFFLYDQKTGRFNRYWDSD